MKSKHLSLRKSRHPFSSRLIGGVFSVFFVISTSVFANSFDDEYDQKPWEEIQVNLPAFPEKENLLPFELGGNTENQFLVDGKSISIDPDGVTRFTLIIISSTGAQNISYEGIRCETYERRAYAFGHTDNTWSKARSNRWLKIKSGTNQYSVLFADHFCRIGEAPLRNQEDARRTFQIKSSIPTN